MQFWNREAYDIAHKITGGSDLYMDLVSHVYLILLKHDIPEQDLPRAFSRFAYNQWRWPESEFNKLFKQNYESAELDYIPYNDQNDIPTEQQLRLDEYLERYTADDTEIFCREVVKMYLCGMTYREIQSKVGLSLDIIHKSIKQFKYDFYNSVDGHRDGKGLDDSPSAKYQTA